jgi:hypothetical protein
VETDSVTNSSQTRWNPVLVYPVLESDQPAGGPELSHDGSAHGCVFSPRENHLLLFGFFHANQLLNSSQGGCAARIFVEPVRLNI